MGQRSCRHSDRDQALKEASVSDVKPALIPTYCSKLERCLVLLLSIVVSISAAGQANRTSGAKPKAQPKTSTEEPAATLQEVVRSGNLPDLRWPNFTDYRLHVEGFYRSAGYSLSWLQKGQPTDRALQMIQLLSEADNEGLNAEDYDTSRWHERIAKLAASHSPPAEARFDVALTICAMRYISDIRVGRINPKHFKFGFDIEHKKLDLPHYLRQLQSSATNLKEEIAKIEPPFERYKATRQALLKYMELAKQDDGEKLPLPIGVVYRGGYYSNMPALAKRLRQLGDMPQDAIFPDDATAYDEPLLRAVQRFQKRHGLSGNGNLDSDTIDQLNVPLHARLEQLRLVLERYRWLRYSFTQPPVVVNLPEFRLRAFDENNQVGLTMHVNVGDAYDFQTPVFENTIRYLVFRPYWNVPPGILREEVIPEIEEDRDYIEDMNMEVVTSDGKVVTSGRISDEVLRQLHAGRLTVRERPGPENALGLLKIIFPNEHHVYMHDTPESRDMFSAARRALSHGCIHLEHPAEMAQWLLRDKPEWTLERVERAMHEGPDNRTVHLTKPVPILIVYATAIIEEDREVHFYPDIYGHDASLEAALAKGYPYP
jgi:L,D-transpeptidase YcbB